MQRRFRQLFTSLKEHGCVANAKIATIGGFCDLDLLIIKATSPDDLPLPDRYVHELLKIFSVSPSSFRDFSLSFTRRFGKTNCWRVALKCLVLLHRLLRSLPDKTPLRTELLWTRSNGLLSLYPCHFRDTSSSASEDYNTFIRSYAQLLDEALDCFSIKETSEEQEQEEKLLESLPDKMKKVGCLLEVLPQLQSLIDRVMDCRPTGAAARNFVVRSAMKHIIRDSFVCYTTFRKEVVVVLDNLIQMPYQSCVAAFGIYKKAALQASQLCEFYDWCKSMVLCGSYEYPFIDRIPHIQIRALETFLSGMWQLTESSSSTTVSPLTSSMTESPPVDESEKQLVKSPPVDESGKQLVKSENVCSDLARLEENDFPGKMVQSEEEKPLIEWEEESENLSWEALLEASASPSCVASRNFFVHPNGNGYGYRYEYGYENGTGHGHENEVNQWQMQVYSPNAQNPFYQPQHQPKNMSRYYG
ncbi:putative clathrin assembly protein At2g25430 [Cornus florida]|uniref:putative clathrin assembly protein At2g25430 n=1 Tax=Cornus florida TaxID=4283 RepID=UPI0028983117|nr:putative clathrin assembly protein At2g25430 [Cornus florida]